MKLKLTIQHFNRPFKRPMSISRDIKTHQEVLVVSLRCQDGFIGYGEAPAFKVYQASIPEMRENLAVFKKDLENTFIDNLNDFWNLAYRFLQNNKFALAAVDIAAHDLFAQRQGKSVRDLLIGTTTKVPESSISIGVSDYKTMLSDLNDSRGWPSLKIKIGFADDIKLLRQLRTKTAQPFRLDANTCWSTTEALEKIAQLESLQIECLEQPLAIDNWEGMRKLAKRTNIPLIADESFRSLEDLDQCAEVFTGVNIKLLKCGGYTPAKRIVAEARQRGLTVMLGCMPESTIGISALAHFAHHVSMIDADSASLFAEDFGKGVIVNKGRLIFPEDIGLGFKPSAMLRSRASGLSHQWHGVQPHP